MPSSLPPAVTGSILRGRERELAALGELISAARDGRGGLVLIEAPAGQGKTRLLAEAVAMARRSGFRVGYGANHQGDHLIQMGALLAALFGTTDPLLDRDALRDLRALPEERYWVLDQLESLLEQAALDAPLLVALDDMQWADAGCQNAVRTLPGRLIGLPIVWVVAYRDGELSADQRDDYGRLSQHGAQLLVLEPLGGAAVADVVDDVIGGTPDEALVQLVASARGNPFLLQELLRGLVEDGLVRVGSGHAALVESCLPTRVRDGMRDRLSRMSGGARRTAQIGSILGSGFSIRWLAAMLDLSPSALLDPVDELVHAELLAQRDGQLAFRHDLIRDAVLDTLPPPMRRALQRQAADVLMAGGAAPLEVAALLAASADPGDSAAIATMLQAVRALTFDDPGAAADLGLRALELAAPGDPHRGPLVAETALLLFAADRSAEAEAFADAALEHALPAEQQAEIRLSVASIYALSADVRVANGRAALALDDVSKELRARHLAWLSHNLIATGRVADARSLVQEAQATVRESGDDWAAFRMAVSNAVLAFVDGRFAATLEQLEAAGRLPAPRISRVFDPGLESTRCEALAATDRIEQGLSIVGAGLQAAQRDRQQFAIRAWTQYRGRRLLELGRLADAAAELEGALDIEPLQTTVVGGDAVAVVSLGRIALHTGDDRLTRACHRLANVMLAMTVPESRRHGAWLLLLQAMAVSDYGAARATLDELDAPNQASVLPQIRFDPTDEPQLVRVALAVASERLADCAVAAAEDRHRLNPTVRSIAASAAHARGLRDDDIYELAAAVELFRTAPRPLPLASALEDLGRAHVVRARRAQGVAFLGEALQVYADCGATWDAARVRGRLRALGVRRRLGTPARPSEGWGSLTESEVRVARLVSQGLTNREVAARMFLSPHTVSMHLRHAFAKLRINSRVELTHIALAHAE